MPQWIHDRERHIKAKNPSMPESEAWAIATQQSYASGNSPSSYGTSEGRKDAKKKYHKDESNYEQTANSKDSSHKAKSASIIDLTFWKGFSEEFQKIAENTASPKNFNPSKPMTVSTMKKMKTVGQTYSKPITDSPSIPGVSSIASGVKSITPPPATVASGA